MDNANDNQENVSNAEEEDDCGYFFLEPASSPYDIKAKIKTANEALLKETCSNSRESKVKFREQLVCYEPDSTLNDISSVESDENTENTVIEDRMNSENEANILEANLRDNLKIDDNDDNVNTEDEVSEEAIADDVYVYRYAMKNKEKASEPQMDTLDLDLRKHIAMSEEDAASIKEELSSEIDTDDVEEFGKIEEANYYNLQEIKANKMCNQDSVQNCPIEEYDSNGSRETEMDDNEVADESNEEYVINLSTSDDGFRCEDKGNQTGSFEETYRVKESDKIPKQNKQLPTHINCRRHCIDRFDSVETMINNYPKRPRCPLLRLQKRNCCEKNEFKKQQKLPEYTGTRSEYGLSASERKEMRKKKAQEKQQRLDEMRKMEEARRKKIEENEKIFMKWLQDISRRKRNNQIKGKRSLYLERYSDNPLPRNSNGRIRPKTAPGTDNNGKQFPNRSKRPQTCPASICIEIPRRILRKGIIIGNVKITSERESDKDYHLMKIF